MTEALKPCPFCGSPAELEHGSDHHGSWFNLGCSMHWGRVDPDKRCLAGRIWYTETDTPEAEAVAAWNLRASDGAPLTRQDGIVPPPRDDQNILPPQLSKGEG